VSTATTSNQRGPALPADRELVQVPLFEIADLRAALVQIPEVHTNANLHQLYDRINNLYQRLHMQLKGRAP
jgi:hypothetical protein